MERRIYGTEHEYGAYIMGAPGQGELNAEELRITASKIYNNYLPTIPHVGQFYANGARYYLDVGDHLEYATPEDDRIRDGVIADEIAGERIVYDVFDRAQKEKEEDKKLFRKFRLTKDIVDGCGTTWGHHENFLADRQLILGANIKIGGEAFKFLAPLWATMHILTGAGYVLRTEADKDKYEFVLGQKALSLKHDFYNGTTNGNKPLINHRDEPHSDKDQFVRIHRTSGDANMSPWAMGMSLGMTAIAITLKEHGQDFSNIDFGQCYYSIARRVARDVTLQQKVTLYGGEKIYPIEVHGKYIEAARKLADKGELSDELTYYLGEWEDAYDDVRTNPESLIDRVEWMARYRFLDKYREDNHMSWNDEAIRIRNEHWADLGPNGKAQKLRQGMWSKYMPPEELIQRRMTEAPETTRAVARGRMIRYLQPVVNAKVNRPVANWGNVSHSDRGLSANLSPFMTEHPDEDKFKILEAAA